MSLIERTLCWKSLWNKDVGRSYQVSDEKIQCQKLLIPIFFWEKHFLESKHLLFVRSVQITNIRSLLLLAICSILSQFFNTIVRLTSIMNLWTCWYILTESLCHMGLSASTGQSSPTQPRDRGTQRSHPVLGSVRGGLQSLNGVSWAFHFLQ